METYYQDTKNTKQNRVKAMQTFDWERVGAALGWQAREKKYSPDQPRVPAGSPDGGQWSDGGTSGPPSLTAEEKLLLSRMDTGGAGITHINAALALRSSATDARNALQSLAERGFVRHTGDGGWVKVLRQAAEPDTDLRDVPDLDLVAGHALLAELEYDDEATIANLTRLGQTYLLDTIAGLSRYGDLDYVYTPVVDGYRFALATGRLPGAIDIHLRSLKPVELAALIEEMTKSITVSGDVPAYMIRKYTKLITGAR